MNEEPQTEGTIMSQNKTPRKTNTRKTNRSRSTSPTAASPRIANKKGAASKSVAPESIPAKLLPSDVFLPDNYEPLLVPEEDAIVATEPDVPFMGAEAMNTESAYEGGMDSGIELSNDDSVAQDEEILRTEEVVEFSTLNTEPEDTTEEAIQADVVPAEESETRTTSERSSGDSNAAEGTDDAVHTSSETMPIVGAEKPVEKVKGLDRQLRAISPRYAAACAEVGRLRKGFINALNSKAVILGVDRVGEAVPVKNSEIDTVDAEIRQLRERLEHLMARKKQLKGSSPELDEVNQTIRELSRQRQAARVEKKAAFEEATTAAAI